MNDRRRMAAMDRLLTIVEERNEQRCDITLGTADEITALLALEDLKWPEGMDAHSAILYAMSRTIWRLRSAWEVRHSTKLPPLRRTDTDEDEEGDDD